SQSGALVYLRGNAGRAWTVAWLDESGKAQDLLPPAAYSSPHVSPDGKRLAMGMPSGQLWSIFVFESQRGTLSRLSWLPQDARNPIWTPDGKHIVFGGDSLEWIRSDGASGPVSLVRGKSVLIAQTFSPDGRRLVYSEISPRGDSDVSILELDTADPDRPRVLSKEPLIATAASEKDAEFSLDGRWLAFTSDQTGRNEIHVQAYPGHGDAVSQGKWQISNGGGQFPRWSRTTRELFFETPDQRIMVAAYRTEGESFVAERPRPWTGTRILAPSFSPNFDVSPDGKHMAVFPRPEAAKDESGMVQAAFLLNFSDELRRRIPPH
ncbi:MAG TPA: hypothetical protein VGH38_08055, partial [Bryobacteraceae bacterium]